MTPFRRQHDGMENRSRARDTCGIAKRRAVEVSDPYADGDVPRESDRPVVVVGLRRSGLCRNRKRKLEAAAAAEYVLACVRVRQDVTDPERRPLRHERARLP